MEYLQDYGGYSEQQIIAMNQTFPPLLTLSVNHQLHPKMRFLKETLGIPHPYLESSVPAEYFGARLEKTLAPRHAWLVHTNLTHGAALFRTPSSSSSTVQNNHQSLWTDFVRAARKPHGMAALCAQWAAQQQQKSTDNVIPTPRQIEAFDVLFGRGLLAMARNELVQHNNSWPLEHFDVSYEEEEEKKDDARMPSSGKNKKLRLTAADLTRLLIQHGANPYALDHRGVSLLHWAAGAGNLPVLKVLMDTTTTSTTTPHNTNTLDTWVTKRDEATLLHWAAAGAQARAFGCGGHVHICEYLLSHWDSSSSFSVSSDVNTIMTRRDYVNAVTLDGNSALHWAAWSGTLDTVKLLVRHRADVHHVNRNGCTVAHWAASGGNVQVCQYLYDICGVDFRQPNHGGNTPLTHAVAFGRANVVEWLRNEVLADDEIENDQAAIDLAQDFVGWLPSDERRKQVLQLFHDFLDYDQGIVGSEQPTAVEVDKQNIDTVDDMLL
jgi:ankyrin repeat protein